MSISEKKMKIEIDGPKVGWVCAPCKHIPFGVSHCCEETGGKDSLLIVVSQNGWVCPLCHMWVAHGKHCENWHGVPEEPK